VGQTEKEVKNESKAVKGRSISTGETTPEKEQMEKKE